MANAFTGNDYCDFDKEKGKVCSCLICFCCFFFVLSKKGATKIMIIFLYQTNKKIVVDFSFSQKIPKNWIFNQMNHCWYVSPNRPILLSSPHIHTHTTPVAWFFFLFGVGWPHRSSPSWWWWWSWPIIVYCTVWQNWEVVDQWWSCSCLVFFLLNTVKKNTIIFQRQEKEKMVQLITNLHYKFLLIIIIEREKNSPQFYIDFEGENKIIIVDNDNDGIIGNNFNWYSFLFIQTIKKNCCCFLFLKLWTNKLETKER